MMDKDNTFTQIRDLFLSYLVNNNMTEEKLDKLYKFLQEFDNEEPTGLDPEDLERFRELKRDKEKVLKK